MEQTILKLAVNQHKNKRLKNAKKSMLLIHLETVP